MKLWVVGLLALLLVGILVFIGKTGAFDTALGLDERDTPRFYDYERGSTAFYDTGGTEVFVSQVRKDEQFILSGLPAYGNTIFKLPVDSRPVRGTYHLLYRLNAAQGVEGVVRVTINGVKRAERLISEGMNREEIEIELTPTEIAFDKLDVRIALIGRGPIEECTPNDTIAAVATVEPQSGLRLELDKPVASVRDKLALWGDLIPVDWGAATPSESATLLASAMLIDRGYGTYFGSDGLSGEELAELAGSIATGEMQVPPAAYPITLVSDASNAGMRRFDRETSWRYRYDVRNLPNFALPASLDLSLALGDVDAERANEVLVSINDRLLYSRRIGAGTERIDQSILIPASLQRAHNELEITLGSVSRDEIRCGAVQPVTAELLPATALRGGGPRLVPELDQLREGLLRAGSVAMNAEGLSAPDAHVAAMLLSHLAPSRLEIVAERPAATIRVVSGSQLAELAKAANRASTWLVYYTTDRRDGAVAAPLSQLAGPQEFSVALAVTLPRSSAVGEPPEGNAGTTQSQVRGQVQSSR